MDSATITPPPNLLASPSCCSSLDDSLDGAKGGNICRNCSGTMSNSVGGYLAGTDKHGTVLLMEPLMWEQGAVNLLPTQGTMVPGGRKHSYLCAFKQSTAISGSQALKASEADTARWEHESLRGNGQILRLFPRAPRIGSVGRGCLSGMRATQDAPVKKQGSRSKVNPPQTRAVPSRSLPASPSRTTELSWAQAAKPVEDHRLASDVAWPCRQRKKAKQYLHSTCKRTRGNAVVGRQSVARTVLGRECTVESAGHPTLRRQHQIPQHAKINQSPSSSTRAQRLSGT